MSKISLGIGGLGASSTAGDLIVTHALGSCVAVVLRCRKTGTVGMVHIALPKQPQETKGDIQPGYYADTALPALLRAMAARAASTDGRNLEVTMVGGAQMLGGLDSFSIGKRNVLAVRKLLWQLGLQIGAEDVEGDISRTVQVTVGTPGVRVSNPRHGTWTL